MHRHLPAGTCGHSDPSTRVLKARMRVNRWSAPRAGRRCSVASATPLILIMRVPDRHDLAALPVRVHFMSSIRQVTCPGPVHKESWPSLGTVLSRLGCSADHLTGDRTSPAHALDGG